MRPYEVALFKHFLEEKGMITPFLEYFRKKPLKANPTSVEEYLKVVDSEEVLKSAFYFLINVRWGHDYWVGLQQQFNEYLEKNLNEDEEGVDPWWYLHGKCKILRTNWDSAKYWRQESRADAAKRLNITLPEFIPQETFNDDEGDDEHEQVAEEHQSPIESAPIDLLAGFDDVDVKPKVLKSNRLKDGDLSINFRSNKGRITFNSFASADIKKRGGYEYAKIITNGSIVAIKLNDENGVNVQDGAKDGNVVIGIRAFAERIAELLGLKIEKDSFYVVHVKEIAKTDDYVAYQIYV